MCNALITSLSHIEEGVNGVGLMFEELTPLRQQTYLFSCWFATAFAASSANELNSDASLA